MIPGRNASVSLKSIQHTGKLWNRQSFTTHSAVNPYPLTVVIDVSYLVIGASSGIAKAVIGQLITANEEVLEVSRGFTCANTTNNQFALSDYTEASISTCLSQLSKNNDLTKLTAIIIFTGVLHQGDQLKPEKALSQLDEKNLLTLFTINTVTPLLWIKHLIPYLSRHQHCKIVALSARIGSIGDNHLGGWYSYRTSKAALNMALKTASIELARSHKQLKLIAYHPGTVDTPLSKPFSKNSPEHRLFAPDMAAKHLLDVMNEADYDQSLSYMGWDKQPICW